jgi:outer membrane protein TolC
MISNFCNCKATLLITIIIFSSLNIPAQTANSEKRLKLNLQKCIELALENNNSRTSFNYGEKIAQAKLKQAKSGHYPSLDIAASFYRMDGDPNYIIPDSKIQIPSLDLGTLVLPPMIFPVPEQNIKLADKQNFQTDINLVLPLFTGGKISSFIEQARAGLEVAKLESKENDQQIILQIKKLFYAALLTTKLQEIAEEAYERFRTTLKFTESAYQNGGSRVTKTDYLKSKTVTETVKSFLIQISGERKNAIAALIFTMGLDYKTEIQINENDFPVNPDSKTLDELVELTLNNNPLVAKVENGIKVFDYKIDQAKSDFYPSVALFGNYRKTFNAYDYGYMTKENKNVWTVGVGLQLNLFNGFRTLGLIEEAEAGRDMLVEQNKLMRKGLTLKVQYLYNQVSTAIEKEAAMNEARMAAKENCLLIEKAYFNDIMDLDNLIEAQITESMISAQHSNVCFEIAVLEAELNSVLAINLK